MKNKFTIEEEKNIPRIIKDTGLSRSGIYRVLHSLSDKKIIYSVNDKERIKYGINYRYDTWVQCNVAVLWIRHFSEKCLMDEICVLWMRCLIPTDKTLCLTDKTEMTLLPL